MHARGLVLAALFGLGACGDDGGGATPDVLFELDGELAGATFFDAPFPSDVRVDADGTQAYGGFPNSGNVQIIRQLLALADARVGAPMMPVAYFRFTKPTTAWRSTDVIAAAPTAPILLVDVDPASPDRGRLVPVVAQAFAPDFFAPSYVVGVAARPGFVLAPHTTYAVVVRTAAAPEFARPAAIVDLAAGQVPAGARGAATAAAYAPLWPTLTMIGVPAADVLTATVFTTGDENALAFARSEAVRAAHDAVIANLHVDTDGVHTDPTSSFCELVGEVTFPQFQTGAVPFSDGGGVFMLDGAGAPIKQADLTVPITITIPAGPMPADGWPLYQFFHGSGGLSSGVVDLGKTLTPTGEPIVGEGPAFVVARYGIAAASAALPANPERLPGASDYAYLNLQNLTAFPFTFQQGLFEQRLLLDALLELQIPAATLASCRGADATVHHFDATKLVAGGQSMGGMYTNIFGAVEPRVPVLVPTGAGGFWNLMILDTGLIDGARGLLASVFQTGADDLTFLHPGMALLGSGWEIAEPMVAMARLARMPLPGHPVHHVYEPVGKGDVYFPTTVYDAAALAYGNQQAGTEAWSAMQTALALDGLDGLAAYPVTANVVGPGGAGTTRVVVQYESDGIVDAHYIYRQLDEVKHQYGCFFDSYVRTGTPTVVAPGPLSAPCQ
ncbi:MAG: hypothetical protein IPL61_35360 [Myxococcales bacterium]|nr:hypothetical protein [Myxococcales bacterium]